MTSNYDTSVFMKLAGEVKVLVIEDDPDHALLVEDILSEGEGAKFKVEIASSGEQALAKDLHGFDIILLDYNLPDVQGLALLSQIRSFCSTPIIMVTGEDDVQTAVSALEKGATSYTLKNEKTLAVLPAVIEKALDDARRRDERVRLREAMIQMEKMASIGELASGVAKEINQPLSLVLDHAEALLGSALDQQREKLEAIRDQALHCKRVVQNLILFSDEQDAQLEQVDLVALLSRTLTSWYGEFNRARISVEDDLEKIPPVLGDGENLSQVLHNVFSNACDAMRECERPRLKISARQRGTDVVLEITDSGPGIPPEHLGRIFDPFFTTKNVGEGQGLGLSVSYGIIKKHGGAITVENAPSAGVRVRIELPAR